MLPALPGRGRFGGEVGSQALGQAQGGAHTGRVGLALAGDVVGGAMIGRGAKKGQAERPIDPALKGHHFKGTNPWSWYIATTAS